ncbi:hypothetical protein DE146DRAFT_641762 [Phaeosphaeria sp. MPI-PUGE-AT-0046c]|nr:hypothetical protein DE146DRAFT_641762 [Phaeosphaeria sp. MPI-PUGE-AT-0046c]
MHTKYIIVVSVILGLCFLSAMALASRFILNKHAKQTQDAMQVADGSNEQQYQLAKISTTWKRMFRPKQNRSNRLWVPTLSGLIKAGDEAIFSTALFSQAQDHHGELALQTLYEMFAKELRSRPMTERSSHPGELTHFLSATRRVGNGPRRVQSVTHRATSRGQPDGFVKSQRKSLDLERGMSRSMSVKRSTPILVSTRSGFSAAKRENSGRTSWMRDGQIAEPHDGSISVKMTVAELAALSVLLGSPLTMAGDTDDVPAASKGAFNISIHVSQGEYARITLRQHKRSKSHLPARGSCCSTLAAKHLAAGFLPFRQDERYIHTVRIDEESLRLLQAGTPIKFSISSGSKQAQWLASLPTARELSLYIADASIESQPQSSNPLIDAISTLAFQGGLVPLASLTLVKAVRFIAAGSLPPARLLQRLEALVDKVNQHAPQLSLFGPLHEPRNAALLYRERERLGRLTTTANATDSIADKASRMQRYVTLIERLMALIPNMKPQDAQAAVQDATRKALEQSYSHAVEAHKMTAVATSSVIDSHGCPESDSRSRRCSTQSPSRSGRQSRASTESFTSPRASVSSSPSNLGKEIEHFLKADLPFSVEDVAAITRFIIVAWTLSVEVVAWDDGEPGFRVLDPRKLPDKMVLC